MNGLNTMFIYFYKIAKGVLKVPDSKTYMLMLSGVLHD